MFLNKTSFPSILPPSPQNNLAKSSVDVYWFPILKKGEGKATFYESRGENSQLLKIWSQFPYAWTTFVGVCEYLVFQEKVSNILVLFYTRTQIKHRLLNFCNRPFGDRRGLSVDEKREKSIFRLLPPNLNFDWFWWNLLLKCKTILYGFVT